MTFSIKFLDDPIPDNWLIKGEQGYLVEVKINDFTEKDTVLTGFWNKEQYINQWKNAVRVLTEEQSITKAAFATAIHDPGHPQHGYVVQWWTAYRNGEAISIRNGSIPYDKDADLIEIENLFDYIPERTEGETSEGELISEWKVSLEDIVQFGKELDVSPSPYTEHTV